MVSDNIDSNLYSYLQNDKFDCSKDNCKRGACYCVKHSKSNVSQFLCMHHYLKEDQSQLEIKFDLKLFIKILSTIQIVDDQINSKSKHLKDFEENKHQIDELGQMYSELDMLLTSAELEVKEQMVLIHRIWLHLCNGSQKICEVKYRDMRFSIERIVTTQDFKNSQIEDFIKKLQRDLMNLFKKLKEADSSNEKTVILKCLRVLTQMREEASELKNENQDLYDLVNALKDEIAQLKQESSQQKGKINCVYNLTSTPISLQRTPHLVQQEVDQLQDEAKFAKEVKATLKLESKDDRKQVTAKKITQVAPAPANTALQKNLNNSYPGTHLQEETKENKSPQNHKTSQSSDFDRTPGLIQSSGSAKISKKKQRHKKKSSRKSSEEKKLREPNSEKSWKNSGHFEKFSMDSSLDHGPLSVPEADRLPSRELGNERPTSIGHKGTSKMKEEESKHGNSMNSQREEEQLSQNQAHSSQFRSAHPSGDSERNQASADEGEEDSGYKSSSESTSEINADSDEEHKDPEEEEEEENMQNIPRSSQRDMSSHGNEISVGSGDMNEADNIRGSDNASDIAGRDDLNVDVNEDRHHEAEGFQENMNENTSEDSSGSRRTESLRNFERVSNLSSNIIQDDNLLQDFEPRAQLSEENTRSRSEESKNDSIHDMFENRSQYSSSLNLDRMASNDFNPRDERSRRMYNDPRRPFDYPQNQPNNNDGFRMMFGQREQIGDLREGLSEPARMHLNQQQIISNMTVDLMTVIMQSQRYYPPNY